MASKSQKLVELCKAAGDPLRAEILRALSTDSFGVQELAHLFSTPQPLMSHHLKILATSGLLETRRQGNQIFYRRPLLRGNEMAAFQASLYTAIDAADLPDAIVKKMNSVYKERSQQSREYFEKNAGKFKENQGMLCEPDQYFTNLKELLELMELPKSSRVMEIGPGQGDLLVELTKRFDKLIALDNSGEMLSLAKSRVNGKQKAIEFVNSSLEAYSPEKDLDAVIMNMVMHHLPSPTKAFQKLGEIVGKQGYLLLADLCVHDQEWAKTQCGDLWLGFDPEDLTEWGKGAGFKEEQALYLGLKNGFQIQLKLFRRL